MMTTRQITLLHYKSRSISMLRPLLLLGLCLFLASCSKKSNDDSVDKEARIQVSTSNITLDEGASGQVNIRLADKSPSDRVVINVNNNDTDRLSTSTNSLIFTPQNWNSDQALNLTSLIDDDGDNNTITLTLSVVDDASAADYRSVEDQTITLTLTDTQIPNPSANDTLGVLKARNKPVVGLQYRSGNISGVTDSSGAFEYSQGELITFLVDNRTLLEVTPSAVLSTETVEVSQRSADWQSQVTDLLYQSDPNQGNNATITAPTNFKTLERAYFKLNQDVLPLSFQKASLGINVPAPQAEADAIHQPQAFVDIFRGARPFREFSDSGISYDEHGWPIAIPTGKKAATLLLQAIPNTEAIPYGHYTVYYEGDGDINYSGGTTLVESKADNGIADIINIDAETLSQKNQIRLEITRTNSDDPIKNIRIVMPGGICSGNPYNHVSAESDCPVSTYQAFNEQLKLNRNAIIFNPDYLHFFRQFSTLRMMNFMEATPRVPASNYLNPCPEDTDSDAYKTCLLTPRTWDERAKMDDATWGGSYRTLVTQRYGVPLEITVALANQLEVHPWYVIPYNADDDYIKRFAAYVYENLKPTLKAHIEYTNEYWNNFWGAKYVEVKGSEEGLGEPSYPYRDEAYSAKVRYYTKRALEIFALWEEAFQGNTQRLYRILGSFTNSSLYTTHALEYDDAASKVDAVAIAPYFHGCWSRSSNTRCANTNSVDAVFDEAQTVDDVFTVLDNNYDESISPATDQGDPNTLSSVIQQIKKHADITQAKGVDLIAYEGGQHLTTASDPENDPDGTTRKRIQALFEEANRDPRMKQKYQALFNAWQEVNGKLFTVFTGPQTYTIYGSFGLKESLNRKRSESTKFDAIMTFQEALDTCWWDGC